jgi:DNA-binding XRE family transcriptional regulator
MSARMKTQTTDESVETNLSENVNTADSRRMPGAINEALAIFGHEIRQVNDEGDELYTLEEVYPDFKPGDMIKGLRVREGITQKEMADKLGIQRRQISEMENGACPIDLEMAKLIEKTFDISRKVFQ